MKKKRFPLSVALFLPIVLGVAVVSGLGFFGAYYSVRQADREDCSSTDRDFLSSLTGGFNFHSPDTLVEQVKEVYYANFPTTYPQTTEEERNYQALYKDIINSADFQDGYSLIDSDMHTSYRDYVIIGFVDVEHGRFVIVVSKNRSGSTFNKLYPGSFFDINIANFHKQNFQGISYYDPRRGDTFFTCGITKNRPVEGDFIAGTWFLSQTSDVKIYNESMVFARTYGYVAIATFASLALASFLTIQLGAIRRIKKLSGQSDSFVSGMHNGTLSSTFGLSTKKHTNELETLNDSLFYMQESIKDYATEIKDATAREQRSAAELDLAKRIQSSMVPSFPLLEKTYQVYGRMKPAREVGGDFYDYFPLGEDKVGFYVADVSGKGVPAALFMARAASISKLLVEDLDIDRINDELCRENGECLFVTGFYAVLDYKKRTLSYVNCGHEPVYIRHDGIYKELKEEPNFPLGLADGFAYKKQTIKVEEGDALFMYTDGLSEAMNVNGDLFGKEAILNTLNEHPLLSGEELIGAMEEKMAEFVGEAEQSDDACLLSFEFYGGAKLDFAPTLEGLATIAPFVDKVLKDYQPEVRNAFQVIVDEFATNIAMYSKATQACLSLHLGKNAIIGTLSDDGFPFNPFTDKPEHDPDTPGGLGIELSISMSKQIHYSRVRNRNVLSFSYSGEVSK